MTFAAYRDVRAVVLGASGFIGGWVARHLEDAGAAVIPVVRDGGRGRRAVGEHGLVGEPVVADLLGADLDDLLEETAPDVVFNLAGYGVDPGEKDDEPARRTNHELVERLARAVSRLPASPWQGLRLVHAGSAAEYGTASGDLREDGPAEPAGAYGRTKLAGTRALTGARESLGIAAVTGRLFTVYGPGEHDGRLLPALLAAAESGEELPMTAGEQVRDFTYVEDVAEGLLRLGRLESPGSPVYNVATGVLTSVRDFAAMAGRVLGIPPGKLRFGALPTRASEMSHLPVNVDRLVRDTGWKPPTSIEAGVRRTREILSSGT